MSTREFHPEVSQAIEEYFSSVGLTQVMAARLLEVTPQAVSLQLKQPFGKNVSFKWSRQFGFNREFLMTGKGELMDKIPLTSSEQEAYNTANRAISQIKKHIKEQTESLDPIPEEMKNEDDYYRHIDIDAYISEKEWDTAKDYNLALEIAEICRTRLIDLEGEIDYINRENNRLQEENKKLFIENSALRIMRRPEKHE